MQRGGVGARALKGLGVAGAELRPGRAVRWEMMALGGILLLAVGLRLAGIGGTSLWLDEFWTCELSTGRGTVHLELPRDKVLEPAPLTTQLEGARPWHGVWTGLDSVTHPPLYFVLLRLWREAFGVGDMAARLFSVAASLAGIVVLFDLGRRLHGTGPALWAALLMAVAQPQIEYAQQVRNYALEAALALGAANVLVRIEQLGASWRRVGLLSLLVLGAALTHYFVIGTLGALFVYALIRLKGAERWKAAGAFVGAGAVFLMVWGPFMWAQRERFGVHDPTTVFLLHEGPGHVWRAMRSLAALPLRHLAEVPGWAYPWACAAGVLFVAPLGLMRGRGGLLLGWLWVVGSVGLVAAMDLGRSTIHLSFLRYTFLAGPGIYLLIGAMGWGARGAGRHVLPGLALGAGLLGLGADRQQTPDWPMLAAVLDEKARAGDLLIFAAPDKREDAAGYMYLGYSHYSQSPSKGSILILSGAASGQVLKGFGGGGQMWLINGSPAVAPQRIVPGYEAAGWKIPGFKQATLWRLTPRGGAKP